jgi:hypothetical protein
MTMTTEQRIELLKKARERKAEIKKELDARKPPSVRGRPTKKPVEETKTLDLVDEIIEEDQPPIPILNKAAKAAKAAKVTQETQETQEESDEEVEEQIIYEKPKQKKKKKIVRKIIRQVESSSDEEVEEQIIYEKATKRTQQARPALVEKPVPQTPPREPAVRNPFFNY